MTTARTHRHNVRRGPTPRPIVSAPKPDDFVPISADTFITVPIGDEGVVPFDPSTLDFDPSDHNTEEVKEYVTAHPETGEAILELELNGKQRSGLLTWLDTFTEEN